jgi:hypothetical protein
MDYIQVENTLANMLDIDCEIDRDTILENMRDSGDDFEVNGHRFIRQDAIAEIQREELSSDLYILGCFNADFLAGILDIDIDAIKAIQDAGAFEALGKLVLPHIDEIQAKYSSVDGYGHHFAHYDGEEHEIGDYYAFRIN